MYKIAEAQNLAYQNSILSRVCTFLAAASGNGAWIGVKRHIYVTIYSFFLLNRVDMMIHTQSPQDEKVFHSNKIKTMQRVAISPAGMVEAGDSIGHNGPDG